MEKVQHKKSTTWEKMHHRKSETRKEHNTENVQNENSAT